MKFFRKNLFLFATVAFLSFVSVLAAEGAHHHDNLESHNDCSMCAWQSTGSSAPSIPVSPLVFFSLVFVFLFVFRPSVISSFVSFSNSGRAPPTILL